MTERKITGWHVLVIFGSAFAIIVGVNLTLAFKAVATFPGLETRNSYVVSQSFQKDRNAQLALGWTVSASITDQTLILSIDDAAGPVLANITSATLGRATHVNDDQSPVFAHDGSKYVADIGTLPKGNWNLRLIAQAENGTEFRQRVIVGTQQ